MLFLIKLEKKYKKSALAGYFLGHCERIKKSFSEGQMSSSVTGWRCNFFLFKNQLLKKFRYLGVFWYRTYGPVTSISGRSILGNYLLENAFKERDCWVYVDITQGSSEKSGQGIQKVIFLKKFEKFDFFSKKLALAGYFLGHNVRIKKAV